MVIHAVVLSASAADLSAERGHMVIFWAIWTTWLKRNTPVVMKELMTFGNVQGLAQLLEAVLHIAYLWPITGLLLLADVTGG